MRQCSHLMNSKTALQTKSGFGNATNVEMYLKRYMTMDITIDALTAIQTLQMGHQ